MKKVLYLCDLFYKLATASDIAESSGGFNWDFFKTLEDPEELFKYAEDNLPSTDEYGSARGVFILDSGNGYALKIALPENLASGVHQNKAEAQVAKILPDITAQIISHHPKFYWMVVELARPLADQEELIRELNLTKPLDIGFLFGKFPPKNHKLLKEPNPIALQVSKLVNEGVLPRDVMKSDSWGHTLGSNPRLVLIDYGKLK